MRRTYRQQIIDEYLNASGANEFKPAEFLDWLEPQQDHRAWELFFGKDDAEAAREYRVGLVRQFVSGLRIRVTVNEAEPARTDHIRISVSEPTVIRLPAFVSPRNGRRGGGGYITTDPTDPRAMEELYSQGAADLARWLERYEGAARLAGADVSALASIIAVLTAASDEAA